MININQYYLYCMGEGWLNRRKYDDDLAHDRRRTSIIQDGIDRMMKASYLRDMDKAALLQRDVQTFLNRPPVLIQKAIQIFNQIAQPIRFVLRTIAQPFAHLMAAARPMIQTMERAVSKVLSFFFGFKKDEKEEKERRDRDDFSMTDLFSKRLVESGAGAGDGGKR